ncbi:MAG TPA: Ldh family oxidoreductase [Pseudolabrys sp.]|nr:Ldh family oxidoreductase [Pseudolabrys sp.]
MNRTQSLTLSKLLPFLQSLLTAGGFNSDEATAIARSLTLSERLGYGSHGLMHVRRYIAERRSGNIVSGARMKIVQETPTSLTVDAQTGVGQIVMPALLDAMRAKAKDQAVVSVAARNVGHIGRLGEWTEVLTADGYASLLLVNDNGINFLVAPPGGKRGATSTNPIAFGIPLADAEMFSVDMSTGAIAFGKVNRARRERVRVPPDCIQDAEGHPTVDPNALFTDPKGSILPMGGAQGYKGFALSMFVDLLVAGLSGGQAPPAEAGTTGENCLVMVAWNPKFYAGFAHIAEQARKYIAFVKASPPVDEAAPVRIPGERTQALRQNLKTQDIALSSELADDLAKLAGELNVAHHPFGPSR